MKEVRPLAVPLLLIFGGLFALLILQWKHDLGSFAESPQHLQLPLGARAIVGGGRATLDFAAFTPEQVTFHIQCAAEEATLDLAMQSMSEEFCQIRIGVVDLLDGSNPDDPPKVDIEVLWKNDKESAQR